MSNPTPETPASGLTAEPTWHHKCNCGIAAGWSLIVEHDPDCPFGLHLKRILAAAVAQARAEDRTRIEAAVAIHTGGTHPCVGGHWYTDEPNYRGTIATRGPCPTVAALTTTEDGAS